MMNAAAALKIDATPMEGFSPAAVNELLKLDELNLNATLIITLGYRHIEDTNQHLKKIRKPISELLITLE
jgi:nitroreductase